jgi:CrcB protein
LKPSLLVLAFVGGGIGSVCRYAMTLALHKSLPGPFPAGTFTVNLVGCFAIGLLGALGLERSAIPPEARTFLIVGVLGGFTTFSSFAWETLELISARDVLRAAVYACGSVVLGLIGVFLGRALGRL